MTSAVTIVGERPRRLLRDGPAQGGIAGRIIGVSLLDTIKWALEHQAIDVALPLAEAAAESDFIYLSQPVERILTTIEEIDQYVRPGALISSDAGSTKAAIVDRARRHIRGRSSGGIPWRVNNPVE